MSIELAPHNKRGLHLGSPIMVGSGGVGFGDSWPPGLSPDLFGAIVTAPLTVRPRKGAEPPRLIEIPGGFLYHTADQNPGYRQIVERQPGLWRRLGAPVLLSLVSGDPGDRAWIAHRLEEDNPGVAGVELLVPENSDSHRSGEMSAFISAVRRATTLPVLVKLPVIRAAELAETCLIAGADALVIGVAPIAAQLSDEGVWLEAPVAGPVALPFTLRALRSVAGLGLNIPLVAAGGIQTLDDVALCLDCGAAAVQVRSLLWTDPAAARKLAEGAGALVANTAQENTA